MSHQELVCNIVKNYDSRYLVPLSYRYDAKTWNAAMKEALERMGLSGKHGGNMVGYLGNHVNSLTVDQMSELLMLHNVLLKRMQEFLDVSTEVNKDSWFSARNRLQEFMDCLDLIYAPEASDLDSELFENNKKGRGLAGLGDQVGADNSISFWLKKITRPSPVMS